MDRAIRFPSQLYKKNSGDDLISLCATWTDLHECCTLTLISQGKFPETCFVPCRLDTPQPAAGRFIFPERSDHMIWQDYSQQLKEVLALDGSPVGVTFSDMPATNGTDKKIMAFTAFYQAARKSSTFNISVDTCTCP